MSGKRYSDGGGKRFKEEPPKRKGKKKAAIVLVSLIAACALAGTGTTLAFLTTSTAPVVNSFSPTSVGIDITEKFDNIEKKDVQIQNTSDIDVYVRATIVVTWEKKNNDGTIVTHSQMPVENIDYTINWGDSGWVKHGDYYYYISKLTPDDGNTEEPETDITHNLIDSCIENSNANKPGNEYYLSVEIIASAIQAEPNTAVIQAWGVDPSALSSNS